MTLQYWGNVWPESSEISKKKRLSFIGLLLGENGQEGFKDEDVDSDEMQRVQWCDWKMVSCQKKCNVKAALRNKKH